MNNLRNILIVLLRELQKCKQEEDYFIYETVQIKHVPFKLYSYTKIKSDRFSGLCGFAKHLYDNKIIDSSEFNTVYHWLSDQLTSSYSPYLFKPGLLQPRIDFIIESIKNLDSRPLVELLKLLLYYHVNKHELYKHTCKYFGICGFTFFLWTKGVISDRERKVITTWLDNHSLNSISNKHHPYFFKLGEIEPRIEFLKNEIHMLKSVHYEKA